MVISERFNFPARAAIPHETFGWNKRPRSLQPRILFLMKWCSSDKTDPKLPCNFQRPKLESSVLDDSNATREPIIPSGTIWRWPPKDKQLRSRFTDRYSHKWKLLDPERDIQVSVQGHPKLQHRHLRKALRSPELIRASVTFSARSFFTATETEREAKREDTATTDLPYQVSS